MAALAERERTSFMAAARRADQAPGMATRSVNAVLGFVKLLDDLAEVASGSGAAAALEAVLEQTGYLAGLRASNDPPQDESRVENLAELVAVVREYERDNPDGSLGEFLEQVSLVPMPTRSRMRRVRTSMPPSQRPSEWALSRS